MLALALAVLLTCAPGAALATTVGTPDQIAKKQAEQTAAQQELAGMRSELDAQAAAYIAFGQEVDRSREAISETESQTVELDAQLAVARSGLNERAVQLYKGGYGDLLDILFSVNSADDLMVGAKYLLTVGESDSQMIDEVTRLHSESLWLQDSLQNQLAQLAKMQAEADSRRKALESEIASQEVKAQELGSDLAKLMRERPVLPTGSTAHGQFDPDTVMSDATFGAANSMSAEDIQAFLERQGGTLGAYRAPDHTGKVKSAAEIISEAAAGAGVNPKVILTTLQKEQSLLSKRSPAQRDYDWAMGCGKTDSTTYTKYQGFGRQVWFGAQTLRKNANRFTPGVTLSIDGSVVRPTNAATFTQYRYTPHFPGVMSFWMLYWTYFGDPQA